jgi:hypothetical protein
MGWFQHRWPGALGVNNDCLFAARLLGCILECYVYLCVTQRRCTHCLIKHPAAC